MQRGSHCLRGPHRRGPQGERGPHLPASNSLAGRTILFWAPGDWAALFTWREDTSIIQGSSVVAHPVANVDELEWRANESEKRERWSVCMLTI